MDYEKINIAHVHSEYDKFTKIRYRQFYKFFPHNARIILDIGCNTGRGGEVLYSMNNDLEITGLDCVKKRLEVLPKNIYKHKIYSMATNINVKDQSYDVVVAGEFIEHLTPEDAKILLKELYRILKLNGRLLLTTPNPDYIRLKLTGQSVIQGSHLSEHKYKELMKELIADGFEIKKVLGTGKVSKFIGQHFPLLNMYGSYMLVAEKNQK